MSRTIEQPMQLAFEPTPVLFSQRMASTLRSLPPRRAAINWRRLAMAAAVPALAIVGVMLGLGGRVFTDVVTHNMSVATATASLAELPSATASAGAPAILQDGSVVNIALFGLDNLATEADSSRSDAILMLSVDPQRKAVKLIGFERDILVHTDNGEQRLNMAIQAGPLKAAQVLADTFGLSVDRYAAVNFKEFAELVDALGGVDIDVEAVQLSEMNRLIDQLAAQGVGSDAGPVVAGQQHLNGRQTLAYMRIRHSASQDVFDRSERQRAVIKKLFEKLSGLTLDELLRLADTLGQHVNTNLSAADLLTLAKVLYAVRDARIQDLRVPIEGAYHMEKTALRVDLDVTRQEIKEFMDSPPPPAPIIVVPHPAKPLDPALPAGAQTVVTAQNPVKNTQSGRLKNIQLACEAIDGTVIQPGETMSFNALVGDPTAQRGYQIAAGGDENGISIPMMGAGTNQVATAIYDAAACANLQIVERHTYLVPAAYVPAGQDAAVDYGRKIDLVFRNTLEAPVQVSLALSKSEEGKWTVTCSLLSTAKLGFTVKLESTVERTPILNPNTVTYYATEAVAKGEPWTIPGRKGWSVRTDKVTVAADGSQKRELFTTDTYPAQGTFVYYNPADPKPTAVPTSNP